MVLDSTHVFLLPFGDGSWCLPSIEFHLQMLTSGPSAMAANSLPISRSTLNQTQTITQTATKPAGCSCCQSATSECILCMVHELVRPFLPTSP